MTTPKTVTKRAHALQLNAQLLALRCAGIPAVVELADGYPSTASGADTGPHGTSELTPTERAAHARLGDIAASSGQRYRPGMVTRLADLDELIHGANDLLMRAMAIVDAMGTGYAVDYTHLRCIGTGDEEGAACHQWQDPRRKDGRCTDCGRGVDSNDRRLRRYAQGAA